MTKNYQIIIWMINICHFFVPQSVIFLRELILILYIIKIPNIKIVILIIKK